MNKTFPKVGEQLYLQQITGDSWVDMVKRPYTVIGVNKNEVVVQEAKCIWPIYHCCGNPNLDVPELEGQRVQFYDTLAESIEEDPFGQIKVLTWHSKRNKWGTKGRDSDYPSYAYFGKYAYQPYLN